MIRRLAIAALGSCALIGAAHAQGGGATNASPITSTFLQTTTATMAAIAANPSRRQIQICGQTATNTLNVTFGTVVTPTSTLGTPIAANACVTFTPPAGNTYMGAQINLIAVTGTVTVLVNEWF